ncbi:MAG: hypothetical protein LBR09_03325 [Endomicrobium sp.]|jgi:hypothetical protein|nr:hypothetical protein [Endomicrobium sp.]
MCNSETLIGIVANALITASVTGFFVFLTNKKMQKANKDEKDNEIKYGRMFKIYKDLFESAAQIIFSPTIDLKFANFVSAFNMSLVEFKDDAEIMGLRKDFLDTTGRTRTVE